MQQQAAEGVGSACRPAVGTRAGSCGPQCVHEHVDAQLWAGGRVCSSGKGLEELCFSSRADASVQRGDAQPAARILYPVLQW